jgi:hypothetical protein
MADQITDTDDTAGPQVAPGMARDLMTREQLQDYLQIGMSGFYRIQRSADPIPSVKVRDSVRFMRSAVDAWLARQPVHVIGPPPGKGKAA